MDLEFYYIQILLEFTHLQVSPCPLAFQDKKTPGLNEKTIPPHSVLAQIRKKPSQNNQISSWADTGHTQKSPEL